MRFNQEIFEYIGSIHQLRRWSQELFAYDFSIIYRSAKMMKDVDACSRHLNTLVHSYLVTVYSMRRRDVITRPYAYRYDVFHRCTNPRRAQVPITPFVSTSSIHYMHHTLHHSSLHFLQSPTIFHMSAQPFRLNPVFITPERITWLSFDSIVSSFCSQYPCLAWWYCRFFCF